MNPTRISLRAELLFAAALLALAFSLRVVDLDGNPAGFFRDEADKGYTSFYLMTKGTDQSGAPWPVFVRSLNVTTSSLYQYIDIPFIASLGLTEFAVRLPACIAGSLSVLAVYLLARRQWGPVFALFAGLFVCLSPWSLLLSRWANQSILLTLWVPLAVFFLLIAERRILWHFLSAICLLLTLYTYATARLFVPLFALGISVLLLIYEPKKQNLLWPMALFWIVLALGSLPLLDHLMNESQQSTSRLSSITIFGDQPLPAAMAEFVSIYFQHWSPWFLFIAGDENLRHNTLAFAQVHWHLAPLIAAGVLVSLKRRSRFDSILLLWLILFPVAAACTRESVPHALRSVYAVPAMQLMAVNGLAALYEQRHCFAERISPAMFKTAVYSWLTALILLPSIHLYDLYARYPVYSAPAWEYGYRETIDWYESNVKSQNRAVVSGIAEYPYIFFLFYTRYSPYRYEAGGPIDRIEFMPTGQSVDSAFSYDGEETWYLARPFELPGLQPEKVVLLPSGEPVWKWVKAGGR